MKQIKLEVGKTYVNRIGESVRIVEKHNVSGYHYKGSNGKWYTESGIFDVFINWSRYDLIEEVKEVPNVSNLLCGSFDPGNKTSSATKCKCGREKWEHPKAT